MIKKSLFYRFTLGLLIGALIMPAHPAHAQFGGIVHDLKGHVLKVKHRVAEAREHMRVFDNAVKQYTTLRDVLGNAEKLVTNQLISKDTMSDIGQTVRAAFQLKEQVQAIVTTRLTMLKSIDDRLRRGIFDPEADLRDLEDYLRTSIGRSSQDSLANLERLRRMDNTLERLIYDLQMAEVEHAQVALEKAILDGKFDAEYKKPVEQRDSASIATIVTKMGACDQLMAHYKSKIEELRGKIKERTEKYHVLMDERIKFADQVDATNKGWTKLNDALDKIREDLYKF